MTATTSSALAYSFFILCTKNIPLTVFILVTLFLLTSFVVYKTTTLLRIRRVRSQWTSKRELILDIESKRPDGDHTSTGKIESLPLISHLRPKAGDRIRSLHRRLITSCGCSAPIYLPIDIKRYSTKDSELSAVHGTENNCHEPCPPTFAERPSSLLLYGSKPGLDSVGRYEGGYVEGVLQTALIRCMLRRPGSSMSFLPF
ncbi:uncharacterized protein EV420DRAFT_1588851 [Desarmillaria tabescens]|uniref:Uncharacterized protein n=1 Tax=Armillaria tabescens TaxID=1929756 RepID=A0AA39J3L2_ARMTA|nr:uncharacterized protein EV420DRAFT_1595120 [Desarmillaria tabescens]XP_060322549.1 uncharacterized protein EV420DRAFT_1588851 [Desarmillaria tabescens]KAK0434865.1 hypothetical protein EV420DRAFT_1595120 [Desarmillaria tabescens]KAK0437277.1 hypothetical protein EV420DRAFT_1588851 [Desarmillaria tabescens]